MGRAGALAGCKSRLVGCLIVLQLIVIAGCGGDSVAPPQSDAQDRLSKLMNLYKYYADKNQKPPPNEDALREFAQKLASQEKTDHLIGEDLESIFVSPRDKQKFNVKYSLRPDPSTVRALAWEAAGKDGNHWVALTNGYTVQYDEETLKQYTK